MRRRRLPDLGKIGDHSRSVFGDVVAAALETYIRATVARIAMIPDIGRRLPRRPGVRVVPLVRYPFKIFYSIAHDTVTVLHIRHAARRQWRGE